MRRALHKWRTSNAQHLIHHSSDLRDLSGSRRNHRSVPDTTRSELVMDTLIAFGIFLAFLAALVYGVGKLHALLKRMYRS